jgi:hypothetical protein
VPIEPGESYLLKLKDFQADFWHKEIQKSFGSDNPVTKNVVLDVQVINFGDGTGYLIGQPFPGNRKNGLRSPIEPTINRKIGFGSPSVPTIPGMKATNRFTSKSLPNSYLFSPEPISFLLRDLTSFFFAC